MLLKLILSLFGNFIEVKMSSFSTVRFHCIYFSSKPLPLTQMCRLFLIKFHFVMSNFPNHYLHVCDEYSN